MPYVTLPMDEDGAIVDLLIGVSQARRNVLTRVGFNIPARVRIKALIDTGSHVTGLQPEVFRKLDLTPLGEILVYTSASGHTPHSCKQFEVSISLAHAETQIEMHIPSVLVIESLAA